MVKSQLAIKISDRLQHLPMKAIEMCVHQTIDMLSDTLSNGRRIEIRGFGSLSSCPVFKTPYRLLIIWLWRVSSKHILKFSAFQKR